MDFSPLHLGRQVHDLDGGLWRAFAAHEDCCGRVLRSLHVRRNHGNGLQFGDQREQVAGKDKTPLLYFVVESRPYRVDPYRSFVRIDGARWLDLGRGIM